MVQLFRRSSFHILLLFCLLFEMLEVEVVQNDILHHLLDGVVVLAYGLIARKLTGKLSVGLVILAMGVVPWLLDLSQLTFDKLELESLLWCVLHVALAFVASARVFRSPTIGVNEICDALSIFLMVGLGFANIYSVVLGFNPGALHHTGIPPGDHIPYGIVLYYSFITQLTVGYGDTLPAASSTRFMSIFQALFGVMYVSTLIARFISIHASRPYESKS
jgi:voltage-gated potassium channel